MQAESFWAKAEKRFFYFDVDVDHSLFQQRQVVCSDVIQTYIVQIKSNLNEKRRFRIFTEEKKKNNPKMDKGIIALLKYAGACCILAEFFDSFFECKMCLNNNLKEQVPFDSKDIEIK